MSLPRASTPATIMSLSAWWNADDDATADGGSVASWTDRVGGRVASAAVGSPVKRATGLNGKPAIEFGAGQNLVTAVAMSTFITATSFSFYAVVRPLTIQNTGAANSWRDPGVFLDSSGFVGSHIPGDGTNGEGRVYGFDGAEKFAPAAGTHDLVINTNYVLFGQLSGGVLTSRIGNGAARTTACGAISDITHTLAMGGAAGISVAWLLSRIRHLCISKSVPTAAQHTAMLAYFTADSGTP